MENETITNEMVSNANEGQSNAEYSDYISAIQEMKQNSVPREDFEKLKKEKSELVRALMNGERLSPENKPNKPSADEYRQKLFVDGCKSDMEYFEATIGLRDAILEESGEDIFVAKKNPTDDELARAEKTARIYKECLDYAKGDALLFKNELMRRTVDDAPVTSAMMNRRR